MHDGEVFQLTRVPLPPDLKNGVKNVKLLKNIVRMYI